MSDKKCTIEGCDKPILARGFCGKHYARWKKWGNPLVCHAHEPKGRICSIPGCGKKHCGQGLCAMHLARKKRNGDPLAYQTPPEVTELKYAHLDTWLSWKAMLDRCYNPNALGYKNYGERGIHVCDEWKNPNTGFKTFLEDMGERPKDRSDKGRLLYSLDRIDTNSGYCKDNCRWATSQEQNRNKRNNVLIKYAGEEHTLIEWSEKLGIPYYALVQRRYYGWPEDRLFIPLQK